MGQGEQTPETGSNLSTGTSSFELFLQHLSAQKLDLEALVSSSILPKEDFDVSAVFTKFAVLLNALKVPGPCDAAHGKTEIGLGAHFYVARQEIQGIPVASNVLTPHDLIEIAAIKKPKFILDNHERLDLSSPQASRQVRHMILEIAALCHPKLRSHTNIVNLLAWGSESENWHTSPFIVLELASNNLADFLKQSRNVPIKLKHHILLDIATGLDAVHDVGLIHGDIKPENVLIFLHNGWWVAKLADFSGGANMDDDSTLGGLGTIGCRAPELRNLHEYGVQLDPKVMQRMDAYSYGLTVWCIFLGDGQSAPCSENANAQDLALSELNKTNMEIPGSVKRSLETSLASLLEPNPYARPEMVGDLLNDGSPVHSEWKSRILVEGSKASIEEASSHLLINELPNQYEWEVQEMNMQNARYLRQAFLRGEQLSSSIIDSLFLKMNGHGERLRHDEDLREQMIKLLQAGVRLNSGLAKAYICQIIDYFGISGMSEIREKGSIWMSEAVVTGSFYARQALERSDAALRDESVRKFRENGGYNQFYARRNSEISVEMERLGISQTNTELEDSELVYQQGDKLLHVVSSALNPKFSNVLEKLDPQRVNCTNNFGETALYRACMTGITSTVLELLSKGANPTIAPSTTGPTCLHWLFNFDCHDVASVAQGLVASGASLHSISKDVLPAPHYPFTLPLGSPLHWAVEMSAFDATRVLLRLDANPTLRNGSDPYAYDDTVRILAYASPQDQLACSVPTGNTLGFSAIDIAVKNWDYNILELLLSSRPLLDPKECDEEGYTAFHRLDAGEWSHTTHMSRVWRPIYGGDPAAQQQSLRRTIAILCHHRFEIDRFSKPSATSKNDYGMGGRTPLMTAVAKGQPNIIKALLEAGADPDCANEDQQTALSSVTERYEDSKETQAQIVSSLLSARTNIHSPDHRGYTLVLRAASCSLEEIVRKLITHGASLNDRVNNTNRRSFHTGWTPLAFFADRKHYGDKQNDGWIVDMLRSFVLRDTLHLTCPEMTHNVKEILENPSLDGRTLLHFAAGSGLIQTCSVLIGEANMNVNSLWKHEKWKCGDKVIRFLTPLDEAIMAKKGSSRLDSPPVSDADYEARLAAYDNVADLLRKSGGVRGRELAQKQFIPNVTFQPEKIVDGT